MTSTTHIHQLLNQGRYLEARVESEKLLDTAADLGVQQIHALALSKSGTPQAAADFFAPVYRDHPDDEETAGIMGGIYKELFRQTQDQKYAVLSRDAYLGNFVVTRSYYTGINASTMSAIAGKFQRGREIAQEVLSILPETSNDFWELVTKAEAKLMTKEPRTAAAIYLQAHQLAGPDWGKINTVYNQLWMLNHYMLVPAEILKAFSPPTVAVLVGHMIDHPKRAIPRFPQQYAPRIKESLTATIKTLNARIGYTSLACGSDILFAEAIEESGGEINIYIPFKKDDFLDTSVRFAGEDWVERFGRIIAKENIHYLTQEGYLGNDELFSFHGRVLFGLATLRGRMLHSEPYLITVLSERDRTLKEGGTRDLLKLWPFPARVQNIDPSKYLVAPPPSPEKPSIIINSGQPNRFVLYMVAVTFSGPIMLEAHRLAKKIETEIVQELLSLNFEDETVYAGFTSSFAAIKFTKDLVSEVERKSQQSTYRISLHAGPVMVKRSEDKRIMTGTHADILKKIFELGPNGTAVASEAFAASLVLDAGGFSFIHTGSVDFGEPLGEHNLYRVNWSSDKKK